MKRVGIVRISVALVVVAFCSFVVAGPTKSLLENVTILTVRKAEVKIPQFGTRPLYIVYVDPDVDDSPEVILTDALKQATDDGRLDKDDFLGMGIVNTKDTWIPNFLIRAKIKRSIKRRAEMGIPFERSPIFLDPTQKLKTAWQLGDCDDVEVVMVVGKDRKIKYLKKIKTRADAKAISAEVVQALIREAK